MSNLFRDMVFTLGAPSILKTGISDYFITILSIDNLHIIDKPKHIDDTTDFDSNNV